MKSILKIERLKKIDTDSKIINKGEITLANGTRVGFATIERNNPVVPGRYPK